LLAGGQGSRLHELTAFECKPALSFAGAYRIVDFTMANAVRSGLSQMIVATQYRPETLHRHLSQQWAGAFAPGQFAIRDGNLITPSGYTGTADAVTANIDLIDAADVDDVMVLAADHIYQMDYAPMIAAHRVTGAVVTVATTSVPLAEASAFGVVSATCCGQITHFDEKPARPTASKTDPDHAVISLGIYVFHWPWLRAALLQDAANTASTHDFGHDILPDAVRAGGAYAYALPARNGQKPYWRDVGTLDTYRLAQLDFASGNLPVPLPDAPGAVPRPHVTGLSAGVLGQDYVLGGQHRVAPGCRTLLDQSVVLPASCVLPGAQLTRVIVAPRTVVPAGLIVGDDALSDTRWYRRTDAGTVLITADMLAARQAALRGHQPTRISPIAHHTRTA
jgi:glucose-1-phosphate adenylyltransferase